MKQDCIRISKCNPWRCRTWVLPCQLRNVGTFKAVDVKSRSPTSIFPPPSVSVTSFCSCRVPSPPPPPFGSKAASVLPLMYLGRLEHHSKKWNISYFKFPLGSKELLVSILFFSVWFFILIFHNIAIHHPFRTNVYKVCTTNPNIGPAMLLPITKLFHHFSRCANGTGWGWNGSIIVRSRRWQRRRLVFSNVRADTPWIYLHYTCVQVVFQILQNTVGLRRDLFHISQHSCLSGLLNMIVKLSPACCCFW